jgi:hypothetical protein
MEEEKEYKMTAADKADLKEMIHGAVDGRFDLIEYKLGEIEKQTIKTNGRVNRLEEKELLHAANCPQAARISEIEDVQKKNLAVRKWLMVVIGIISTLAGVAWIVIEIISKLSAAAQ